MCLIHMHVQAVEFRSVNMVPVIMKSRESRGHITVNWLTLETNLVDVCQDQ